MKGVSLHDGRFDSRYKRSRSSRKQSFLNPRYYDYFSGEYRSNRKKIMKNFYLIKIIDKGYSYNDAFQMALDLAAFHRISGVCVSRARGVGHMKQ